MDVESRHADEIRRGERFEFGKNWSKFLSDLTVPRIKLAEASLRSNLEAERLDGKTFLDVGSGSGLFSLAARRLGAKVHSFDYDPKSVACTRELKRRYFAEDPNWTVEQGSVLDRDYLTSLGQSDVVYSWGVLHHTGRMWEALSNVKPLVPIGGQLFIAIYNDQGRITDEWARIKERYNALASPLAFAYALRIIGATEAREFARQYRNGTPRDWLRSWTDYQTLSTRGMSKWYDWIDWIGGHPYERASVEQIVDTYSVDGFRLTKLFDCSGGYGCNEFVFRREAGTGVFVESRLSGGRSLARRYGRRIVGPFRPGQDAWLGNLAGPVPRPAGSSLLLIRDDRLVGPAEFHGRAEVAVAPLDESEAEVARSVFHVIAAKHRAMDRPFGHTRGRMWQKDVPELAPLADDGADPTSSPVMVFEGESQLPYPHSTHDDIDQYGEGRFSHWGTSIYFSSLDGADPNTNEQVYRIVIAAEGVAPERSMAQRFGRRLEGPFERSQRGWTAAVPDGIRGAEGDLFLMRDDEVIGRAEVDDAGRLVIAEQNESEAELDRDHFIVRARAIDLLPPFTHGRGQMWEASVPDLGAGDQDGAGTSTAFIFEDGRQLPFPHAMHDAIDSFGSGRFSHWGAHLFFSSADQTDPNENGRRYQVFVACAPGR